jgi:DNA-binding PadR family transcriptional regulator
MAEHGSGGWNVRKGADLGLAALAWAWVEMPECMELSVWEAGEGQGDGARHEGLDTYYGTEYSPHTMNGDAINSPLTLAVMGMLHQWPQSGYDLMKLFESSAIGNCSSSPGAVYPALKRLEEAGLIAGEVENEDTLRPRQVYHVTDAGEEALRTYLEQPITRDDVVRRGGDVLLRFVFAGSVLGTEEAARILTEYADETEAYVPALEAELKALPGDIPPFGRYGLQHAIGNSRWQIQWARRVVAELRGGKPGRKRRS